MAGSVNRDVLAEPDLRRYVYDQLSTLAERMMARLSADKKAGLLPPDLEPQVVVPIIITYLQGLWRMALVSYDRNKAERQVDTLLTGLGL
jgi:TetR/AcrR family transcriptional repressor of nem operon